MGNGSNGDTRVSEWIREQIVLRRDQTIMAGDTPDGLAIGREVWAAIRIADLAGEPMAVAAVDTLGLQRVNKWAGDLCRAPKVEAAIAWNGNVVRHPVSERYAMPVRPNGTAKAARVSTYPLFVDMPREEYFVLLARHQAHHDVRGQTIAVLLKGAQLLEQYPDAPTLRDACDLAGVDWRDYLVDESVL